MHITHVSNCPCWLPRSAQSSGQTLTLRRFTAKPFSLQGAAQHYASVARAVCQGVMHLMWLLLPSVTIQSSLLLCTSHLHLYHFSNMYRCRQHTAHAQHCTVLYTVHTPTHAFPHSLWQPEASIVDPCHTRMK